MKRLVIHMGMPKCGSSSIQNYMAELDAVHRSDGLCYPLSSRTHDGYRNHDPLVRLSGAELGRAADAVIDEILATPQVTVGFLSAEGWGSRDRLKNLCELVQLVRKRLPGCEVGILAYMRNPFGYVESCYAQMIFAGLFGVHARKFFLQDRIDISAFAAAFKKLQGYPIHSNLSAARVIRDALPGIPVSFRSIERGDSDAGSLLADLCAFLGLPFRPDMAGQPRNQRINLRQLTVLRQARRRLSSHGYEALRPLICDHPLCLTDVDPAVRMQGMHVGEKLATRIRASLAVERDELAALFDTRVDGLCEDGWQPINATRVMTGAEVRQVIADVRRSSRTMALEEGALEPLLNLLSGEPG